MNQIDNRVKKHNNIVKIFFGDGKKIAYLIRLKQIVDRKYSVWQDR
jgi:hypothetical protein